MANLVADTGVFCFCYGGVVHAHSRTWRQGQRSNGKHGTAISFGGVFFRGKQRWSLLVFQFLQFVLCAYEYRERSGI